MNKCDKDCALSVHAHSDVHVARVVVHAEVGLMLVLIARVIVNSFCRRVSVASFLYLEVYSLHPTVGDK